MNIKAVIVAAAAGFVLSFLTGLLSGAVILIVLLRAVIFAVVFGGLCAGIQLLADKFLGMSSAGELSTGISDVVKPVQTAPVAGSVVNLTISDEDLPKEDNGPQFFVGSTVGLAPAPQAHDSPVPAVSVPVAAPLPKTASGTAAVPAPDVAAEAAKPQGFVPVSLGQQTPAARPAAADSAPVPAPAAPAAAVSSSVPEQPASEVEPPAAPPEDAPEPSAADSDSSGSEELDELPDLGDMSDDGGGESTGESLIQDSEFASDDGEAPVVRKQSVDVSSGKDTELIAQAIRTVLANEE